MKLKKLEHESLKQYFDIVRDTGTLLLVHLNNQLVFKQKLEMLEVTIKLSDKKTEGFLMVKPYGFSLLLLVNPRDDEKLIRLIIAHELVHLLFAPVNKLNLSGYCSTDDSFDITNVKRISNGSEEYGNIMEEMLCDYLALKVLSNIFKAEALDNIIFSANRSFHLKENIYLIEEIIELFGDLPDAFMMKKIDAYTLQDNGDAIPDNFFIYSAVTGIMNLFVNEYDNLMGAGSWKRFNQNLECYIADKSDKVAKELIDIEIERYQIITSN